MRRGFAQAIAELRDSVAGRPVYLCWDMDVFGGREVAALSGPDTRAPYWNIERTHRSQFACK
jgi:hypothetical protein